MVEGDEAAHAVKSRRLRPGDEVQLTNGLGSIGNGIISIISARPVSINIEISAVKQQPKPATSIILASAIPKGDRQNVLLDMATQLGMTSYIPIDCEYSAVRYQSRMRARWQRIIHSACKQSRRAWFPEILDGLSLEQLIHSMDADTLLLTGDQFGQSLAEIQMSANTDNKKLMILVGPEGGFSQPEFDLLHAVPDRFALNAGSHILRTETAAIALLSVTSQLSATACDSID